MFIAGLLFLYLFCGGLPIVLFTLGGGLLTGILIVIFEEHTKRK